MKMKCSTKSSGLRKPGYNAGGLVAFRDEQNADGRADSYFELADPARVKALAKGTDRIGDAFSNGKIFSNLGNDFAAREKFIRDKEVLGNPLGDGTPPVRQMNGYKAGGVIGDASKDKGVDTIDAKVRPGEYMLNPETVADAFGGGDHSMGVRNLNSIVRNTTGKEPGAKLVGGKAGFEDSGVMDKIANVVNPLADYRNEKVYGSPKVDPNPQQSVSKRNLAETAAVDTGLLGKAYGTLLDKAPALMRFKDTLARSVPPPVYDAWTGTMKSAEPLTSRIASGLRFPAAVARTAIEGAGPLSIATNPFARGAAAAQVGAAKMAGGNNTGGALDVYRGMEAMNAATGGVLKGVDYVNRLPNFADWPEKLARQVPGLLDPEKPRSTIAAPQQAAVNTGVRTPPQTQAQAQAQTQPQQGSFAPFRYAGKDELGHHVYLGADGKPMTKIFKGGDNHGLIQYDPSGMNVADPREAARAIALSGNASKDARTAATDVLQSEVMDQHYKAAEEAAKAAAIKSALAAGKRGKGSENDVDEAFKQHIKFVGPNGEPKFIEDPQSSAKIRNDAIAYFTSKGINMSDMPEDQIRFLKQSILPDLTVFSNLQKGQMAGGLPVSDMPIDESGNPIINSLQRRKFLWDDFMSPNVNIGDYFVPGNEIIVDSAGNQVGTSLGGETSLARQGSGDLNARAVGGIRRFPKKE